MYDKDSGDEILQGCYATCHEYFLDLHNGSSNHEVAIPNTNGNDKSDPLIDIDPLDNP
jgi:hypothetical protein